MVVSNPSFAAGFEIALCQGKDREAFVESVERIDGRPVSKRKMLTRTEVQEWLGSFYKALKQEDFAGIGKLDMTQLDGARYSITVKAGLLRVALSIDGPDDLADTPTSKVLMWVSKRRAMLR